MDTAVPQPGRRFRWRWYHVALPVLAALLPLGLYLLNTKTPPAVRLEGGRWVKDTGDYVGVEPCRECHNTLVEKQLASTHAQTIRSLSQEPPRAPIGTGQTVADPLTGAQYSVVQEEGKPVIKVEIGGTAVSQPLDYEFGAGKHAFGYLSRAPDGSWVDARLNYYSAIKGWGFTSSQDKAEKHLLTQPLGRPQQPGTAARCFTCHSTVVRADGIEKTPADGSGLTVRPEHSMLNVTCEACHGPQGKHVREKRANAPVARTGPLPADAMNAMCGRCHGLSDVDPAHPVIARFQPWGLSQSRCFQQSAGKLSCATCHDPHENARRDLKFYEAACLSCHSPKPEVKPMPVLCPVNRKQGCVGCHMPTDSKSMPHVKFFDHRIRVVRTPPNGASK